MSKPFMNIDLLQRVADLIDVKGGVFTGIENIEGYRQDDYFQLPINNKPDDIFGTIAAELTAAGIGHDNTHGGVLQALGYRPSGREDERTRAHMAGHIIGCSGYGRSLPAATAAWRIRLLVTQI